MAAFLDLCRFTPTAGGTTDWTVSSAVTGYVTPAGANAVNGRLYKYRAESANLSEWELGEGAYNTGTGVLARTTIILSSNAAAKVNFTSVPQVAVVALKEDLISIEEVNSFTSTQKDQARVNILAAGVVRDQKFTASGTYTPNANLIYCIIECVGGGGGAGSAAGGVGKIFSGGGGGSGGYSRIVCSAATIGASQTVTIGAGGNGGASGSNNGAAGGDTSVGALCIGKGGAGGLYGSTAQVPLAGAGGVAGTGDLTASGMAGLPGFYNDFNLTVAFPSGGGGSSAFGGGAQGVNAAATTTAGNNGTNYGGGGSGAATNNVAANAAGGNGSAGVVFITEICSK